jgi:hypothetical protein
MRSTIAAPALFLTAEEQRRVRDWSSDPGGARGQATDHEPRAQVVEMARLVDDETAVLERRRVLLSN